MPLPPFQHFDWNHVYQLQAVSLGLSATSNQPAVLFSHNKPAPAISQTNRVKVETNLTKIISKCSYVAWLWLLILQGIHLASLHY
jgi:hypothetical protein